MDLTSVATVKAWLGLANTGSPVTAITRSSPGVVTCPGHGLLTNALVAFSGLMGMTQLNGQICMVTVVDADHFQINVDTSGYGAYVGGGILSADDVVLQRIVTGLSAGLQLVLSRTFAATAYSEVRNGSGKRELMVLNDPIISVEGVTVNDVAVSPRAGIGQAGYSFDTDTIYLEGSCFARGVQNVRLRYTGGFSVLPADIDQDVCEATAFLYRERDRIGLASKSVASGDQTNYLRDLPPHLMRRLMQYNRAVRPPT